MWVRRVGHPYKWVVRAAILTPCWTCHYVDEATLLVANGVVHGAGARHDAVRGPVAGVCHRCRWCLGQTQARVQQVWSHFVSIGTVIAPTGFVCPVYRRARHVTHPYHYVSTYYADKPWLNFVDESHIRCSVEVYKVKMTRHAGPPRPRSCGRSPSRRQLRFCVSGRPSQAVCVRPCARVSCRPSKPVRTRSRAFISR